MSIDNEINLSGSQGGMPGTNPSPVSSSPLTQGLPRVSVLYSRFQPCNELPWIIKALIKTKLVRDEKQAEKLLLVFILLLIIAAVVLFALSFQEQPVNI